MLWHFFLPTTAREHGDCLFLFTRLFLMKNKEILHQNDRHLSFIQWCQVYISVCCTVSVFNHNKVNVSYEDLLYLSHLKGFPKKWRSHKQAHSGEYASGLCLCVYWSCDLYGETDGWTDGWNNKEVKEALKRCLSIIWLSIGSHRGRKTRFLHRRNGRTDGRTDIPSYRDARTHLKWNVWGINALDSAWRHIFRCVLVSL